MRKLMMYLTMVVMTAALLAGCGKGAGGLAGQWVPAEYVDTDHYPENMVLKADGTGTVDGMNINWSAESGAFRIVSIFGDFKYSYVLSGSDLELDGFKYRKVGGSADAGGRTTAAADKAEKKKAGQDEAVAADVLKAVDKGDYREAAELYAATVAGHFDLEQQIDKGLRERIEEVVTLFNEEKISIEEAELAIGRNERSGIHDMAYLSNAKATLKVLSDSKDAYAIAGQCAASGDHLKAAEQYALVNEIDANYDHAQELRLKAVTDYKEAVLRDSEAAKNTGDYEEALLILQTAMNHGCNVEKEFHGLVSAYEKETTDEAAACFENGNDYASAINVITTALGILGSSETLEAELERYKTYMPVLLAELEPLTRSRYLRIGTEYERIYTDAYGTTHTASYVMYPGGGEFNGQEAETEDEGCVEYFLNAQYHHLRGTLYLPYVSRAHEEASLFRVYGDGTLLYEGPQLSRQAMDPVDIDVDISGVRELRIVMMGVWYDNTGWIGMYTKEPMIGAANLTVQK